MESLGVYFNEVSQNSFLKYLTLFSIFVVAIYNFSAVSITKHINALARTVAANTKPVIVWIIGIIVTLTLGRDNKNYRW